MTAKKTSEDLREEFAKMRRAGMTFREIGARWGLSHERVRQVLTKDGTEPWPRVTAREKRASLIRQIAEWLDAHGPVPRDRVLAEFDLTNGQLAVMVTEGLPTHMIMLPTRDAQVVYSEDDVNTALTNAWARLLDINPRATGLSHAMYEKLRDMGTPSAAGLEARYGWEEVCRRAGIPSGMTWRSKDSYGSRWDDDDIIAAVATYLAHARAAEARPTYTGYDRFQQLHADLPSGTLVRNRMRDLGVNTWAEIVARAATHSKDAA